LQEISLEKTKYSSIAQFSIKLLSYLKSTSGTQFLAFWQRLNRKNFILSHGKLTAIVRLLSVAESRITR